MIRIDIASRHAGQILGRSWLIFSPIAFLSIYTIIYAYIFKLSPNGLTRSEYVIYIFSGLIPYMSFAECLQQSSQSIKANESILKNLTFPLIIVPVKAVLISHINLLVSTFLILLTASFLGLLGKSILFLPIVMVLQVFFLMGLGLIASLITVAFKDLTQMLTYINMVLMIASPIAYTPDMVPSNLQFILWLNPLTYFISLYRTVIVYNSLPDIKIFTFTIFLSLFSFYAGSFAFNKVKKVIINYV